MALGLVLWSVLPCDSGPIVSMDHRPMGQGTHGSLYLGHRSILAVTASRWAFGCEFRVEFPDDFPFFLVNCYFVFSIGFTTLFGTRKIHTQKLIDGFGVRLDRRPK